MRTLNIPLEDSEYEELKKAKGDKTWKQYILDLVDNKWEEKDG